MPDNETNPTNKTAEALEGVNQILSQFIPLVGVGFSTARMVMELLKRQGVDIGPFEAEIVQFEAARVNISASIADFHTKFGTGTPAPLPDGGLGPAPTPGETTTIGG